jgi:hypothetical protein
VPPPYKPAAGPVQRAAAPPHAALPKPVPIPASRSVIPARPAIAAPQRFAAPQPAKNAWTRVAQPSAQARPATPAAYRPGAIGPALPAAQAPAAARVPAPYRPANLQRAPIQRYQVLPPAKIHQNAPVKRPWFGYPYAIVGNAPFNAQAQAHGVGGVDEFLTGPGANAANIVNHPGGLSLRVSSNADMAIEESDLRGRQPKAFYATTAIVNGSNQRLTNMNSRIQLEQGAASITIWTGWWSQNVLRVTTPRYKGGNADALPQNCNAVGAAVTGWDAEAAASRGGQRAAELAARQAPRARVGYRDAYNAEGAFDEPLHVNAIAHEYATTATPAAARALNANQFARPAIGEAFMIATVGTGPQLPGGLTQVHDYASGTNRDLGWAFHFGGVVAKSGSDYITLENYARGDNRQNQADPRWYFQMYGEAQGQSFHEFHDARQDYANPITIAVNANTTGAAIHRMA